MGKTTSVKSGGGGEGSPTAFVGVDVVEESSRVFLYAINIVGHSTGSFCIRYLGRRTYVGPHMDVHVCVYVCVRVPRAPSVAWYVCVSVSASRRSPAGVSSR